MHIIKKICIGVVALFLVANTAVWLAVYDHGQRTESESRILTVAFLDVGQGDAIFIEAPNGNQVLVDGGPNAKVLSELGKVMKWYDKSIDMIVVTNPDKDHIAGFIDVLKRFEVSQVVESGTLNATLVNKTLHEFIDTERAGPENKPVEKIIARRGMEFVLDEKAGVVLTVLFPDHDVSAEKTNDGSIVMRLTYGETEVMLTGDAPSSVEKRVLELAATSIENLQSDILKVGHHGSKTSTDENFVRALNPTYAVISLGKENKYGHPNEQTLNTLGKFPLKILRTDQEGTIVMKSDGRGVVLEE